MVLFLIFLYQYVGRTLYIAGEFFGISWDFLGFSKVVSVMRTDFSLRGEVVSGADRIEAKIMRTYSPKIRRFGIGPLSALSRVLAGCPARGAGT